jgi:hypothetical protein
VNGTTASGVAVSGKPSFERKSEMLRLQNKPMKLRPGFLPSLRVVSGE